MNKSGKIINALLAFMLAGVILLLSDMENRSDSSGIEKTFSEKAGLQAVPGRIYKIGLTYFGPDATFDAAMNGVWDGLKALGFVRDSNLKVIAQHANGEVSNPSILTWTIRM